MIKLIKYIAAFAQDQNGNPSSKRLIGFVAMFYLFLIVKESLNGSKVDFNVLLVVAGLILFSIGAVTAEFFKDRLK